MNKYMASQYRLTKVVVIQENHDISKRESNYARKREV